MAVAELCPDGIYSELIELKNNLEGYGDQSNAKLLNTLLKKLTLQELTVTCCGYVSSGKSRLLNQLVGLQDLLPVSPLPSSVNTVWIKEAKEPGIKLNYKDNPPVSSSLPEQQRFQQLCQEDKIESIELGWPRLKGLSFIDTPGIDSLESGEQLLRNPALLMADLVIYLTDYNHVQSQVNFNLLRNLENRNIPYLLVVNQIDKHVALELSMAEFRAKLMQALSQWDLKPTQIYLTNLGGDQHLESQFKLLEFDLHEWQKNSAAVVPSTVIRSVKQVLSQHNEFYTARQEEQRQPHLWVTEQSVSEQEARDTYQYLTAEIDKVTAKVDLIAKETLAEMNKVLENAPLFSYETRQLAQKFMESRQQGFKAGLFANIARTRAEQELRLQRLHAELVTRSEANLTWHLRKILVDIPTRYQLSAEDFSVQAAEFTVLLEPELLVATLRTGAVVSGDYVMNYTRDLTSAIKTAYRQACLVWIERAQALTRCHNAQELAGLQENLEQSKRLLAAFNRLTELDACRKSHMDKLLEPWEQRENLLPATGFAEYHKSESKIAVKIEHTPSRASSQPVFPGVVTPGLAPATINVHPKLAATAGILKACVELTQPLLGCGLWAEALTQRSTRLEHNLFTVALFGAFSAGKSSLANAMLGDNILPVSPNPTTAAINKILPPTEAYPHGTIRVKLKTPKDLTNDLVASLNMFDLTAKDLAEALALIPGLVEREAALEAKPHWSFLRAVARGQGDLLSHLGEELIVGFADFRDFVVQEDKACFVEWIEVYYSCPLTQMGVVLVDTPGSNSTNSRHTSVAFDYIKNADAVLFVTYFNNPFCKADAQFLAQLGKVKDSFALDKMFFIVNAADLAQTPQELAQVLDHVEQSLRALDIIRPRLFPVSSQLALMAKLDAAGRLQPETELLYRQRLRVKAGTSLPVPDNTLAVSGLMSFETSFYSFIEQDLINLALKSAHGEILGILQHVEGLLAAAKTDASQREAKQQHLHYLEQQIITGINNTALTAAEHALKQEIDELLYYVNQRFSQRFADMFNRSFYALSLPKEEQPKLALQHCLSELLQEFTVELEQEIRATSLRLERFVQNLVKLVLSKHIEFVQQYDQHCSLQSAREIQLINEPKVPALAWNSNAFTKLTSLYKNPKDWLEGQGRTKMRESLLHSVQLQVDAWLKDAAQVYKLFWQELLQHETAKLKEQIAAEIADYYHGLQAALGTGYDSALAEHVYEELTRIVAGER